MLEVPEVLENSLNIIVGIHDGVGVRSAFDDDGQAEGDDHRRSRESEIDPAAHERVRHVAERPVSRRSPSPAIA